MITREQVADLQPGDIVEISDDRWPGVVISGPVRITENGASYAVGEVGIAPTYLPEYREPYGAQTRSLTIVSRAPRPLYVNHDRSDPRIGDVVRSADEQTASNMTWVFAEPDAIGEWRGLGPGRTGYFEREHMPERLRLLVDGETGQVVP